MKRRGIHRGPHLVQKQRVRIVQLVAPTAPKGAASVIPQNERIVISRIILPAEIQERRQRLRISHVGIPVRLGDDPVRALARHVQHAIVVAGHTAYPPGAPAREDHHIETVKIKRRRVDLINIIRSTSQLALQVRTDHIDHDRICFLLRFIVGFLRLRERRDRRVRILLRLRALRDRPGILAFLFLFIRMWIADCRTL